MEGPHIPVEQLRSLSPFLRSSNSAFRKLARYAAIAVSVSDMERAIRAASRVLHPGSLQRVVVELSQDDLVPANEPLTTASLSWFSLWMPFLAPKAPVTFVVARPPAQTPAESVALVIAPKSLDEAIEKPPVASPPTVPPPRPLSDVGISGPPPAA
jgi:hypothetical protein